ncbi:hypothetical protein FRUB_03079 [Fimbriiglobus ruber]|uniref:Uncharacterized protein n=1 Tax=Fimbriiglobus ruber TaxID=1908690 RepID=A0A225DPX0_9BACT|nr:hypothetical protein FRUB_03079 [Fimbriiglobus ruber]
MGTGGGVRLYDIIRHTPLRIVEHPSRERRNEGVRAVGFAAAGNS